MEESNTLITVSRPNDHSAYQQVDGSVDHYMKMPIATSNRLTHPSIPRYLPHHQPQERHSNSSRQAGALPVTSRHRNNALNNVVADLLPYCTTEPPLRQEQVIALSDIVGSLREFVLLALGASSGEAGCADRLISAVGEKTAGNIVDFFVDEYEVE
ncbi:hypothetical protein GQ44DRAFT_681788 [Phaeosphaeriaceae sp. PMI808]|nr:hypothetical protein GQ44DRAFT_681788 [Phaeosphaeriaceae sp. PMI808]